jgi:transcriptional regulator
MYIPPLNRVEDWKEIQLFVAQVRAADLVTVNPDGLPVSTLMPMMWVDVDPSTGNYGRLIMHMARGNQQWKTIQAESQGLAILHGGQAYISPTNYGNKVTDHKVVPTWNYESVHLSGTVEVSEDIELLRQIVTELTAHHELNRELPWSASESDPHYFELQLKGIIAVILHVNKVEAKSKISQNKSEEDRKRIVEDLFTSGIPGEEVIATQMQRYLKN